MNPFSSSSSGLSLHPRPLSRAVVVVPVGAGGGANSAGKVRGDGGVLLEREHEEQHPRRATVPTRTIRNRDAATGPGIGIGGIGIGAGKDGAAHKKSASCAAEGLRSGGTKKKGEEGRNSKTCRRETAATRGGGSALRGLSKLVSANGGYDDGDGDGDGTGGGAPPPPPPASALRRQHTDVSALTWDGGDDIGWFRDGGGGGGVAREEQEGGGRAGGDVERQGRDAEPLACCSPPCLPVRQPTLGGADAKQRPSSLGRHVAVAGLIDDDDDEHSVDHHGVVAFRASASTTTATQPPKMPVRKVSNLAGASSSSSGWKNGIPRTDPDRQSTQPPALPLRQATLTTVATADSTALGSVLQVVAGAESASNKLPDRSKHDRYDESGAARARPTDPRASAGPSGRGRHHHHPAGGGTRRGAEQIGAHPPTLPVRQASLVAAALADNEPAAAEEGEEEEKDLLPSDCFLSPDRVVNGRPWGCPTAAGPFVMPLSPTSTTAEGPPHPPSRKASA